MPKTFMKPLRIRFTHPDDVEKYGTDWYVYDEHRIADLPGRELAALESEMGGRPMPDIINAFREGLAMGDLWAFWLALKMTSPDICPPFDEFDVHTMLAETEAVPDDELGKDSPAQESPPTRPSPSLTVVALPT